MGVTVSVVARITLALQKELRVKNGFAERIKSKK